MSVTAEFHKAFNLPAPSHPPRQPDPELVRLRLRLIGEEFKEVRDELEYLAHDHTPDEVVAGYRRLLKELADLRYVAEGCAVTFALPIDPAYEEVHRSNMSKLGPDGEPLYREDGKVLKGPNYTEADMKQFVPSIIEGDTTP